MVKLAKIKIYFIHIMPQNTVLQQFIRFEIIQIIV